ncbi:hypothetical protein M0802_003986 [Mischocyttarus mexicanus]|nr:hypothetical protein M0802_003986 [Mischocyttarus mexicanus]
MIHGTSISLQVTSRKTIFSLPVDDKSQAEVGREEDEEEDEGGRKEKERGGGRGGGGGGGNGITTRGVCEEGSCDWTRNAFPRLQELVKPY